MEWVPVPEIGAGLYDKGQAGETIEGPLPVTYGLDTLPSYCCHEPALEAASISRFGAPMFIVNPAVQLGKQPCHVYVYKDLENIPERYYDRVGLDKDENIIARAE